MKLRLMFSFVKWCFSKFGQWLVNLNSKFHSHLQSYTGEALMIWLMASAVLMIFVLILALVIDINTAGYVVLAYWASCFLYLFSHGVTILFEAFTDERQQLFNHLKG